MNTIRINRKSLRNKARFLLAAFAAVSLFVSNAKADEEVVFATVGSTDYTDQWSFATAFGNLDNSVDVTIKESFEIYDGLVNKYTTSDIILDLNGCTLTSDITSVGNLIIIDSSSKKTGVLVGKLDCMAVKCEKIYENVTLPSGYKWSTTKDKDGYYTLVESTGKDYPAYILEGNKEKYDAWVETYGITDRIDASAALQNAYLLNVAPAQVTTAAAEFKCTSITVNPDGSVTITTPAGKNYNGTVSIIGCESVNGKYKEESVTAKTARFFMAVLK